jgi:hypothetical protein
MTVPVDETTVREFIDIISSHATQIAKSNGHGVLQLCQLSPLSEKMVPSRFRLDDVDTIVKAAVGAANANLNVYIEARLVRADLRGNVRGGLSDTELVFGIVVDADNDKGKGGSVMVRPSLLIETSPGNFHYWYLLSQPVTAHQAKTVGDTIRDSTGTDHATGVITQCYRVAGTPNFPSKAKQARGRVSVEPTRIVERTGRLWDPFELMAAFATQATSVASSASAAPSTAIIADESSLPDELMSDIRGGGVSRGLGVKKDKSRSGLFHNVIGELKKRRWSVDQIHALLEKHPNGVAAKYEGRLLKEVQRSYEGVEKDNPAAVRPAQQPGPAAAGSSGGSGGLSPPPPPPGATPGPASSASAPLHVLPTIRLRDGQLPRAVEETEKAVRGSGAAVFSRAGYLVYPTGEIAPAANGAQTVIVRLSEFTTDSFIEPVAESAIFQRYNMRRQDWIDIDPPIQLVRMVLARDRKWKFPRVAGVITTPTLRPDGSLLAAPGYDPLTELYLWPGFVLPPIPQQPTREQALEALATLKDLFVEFSFKRKRPAIDLAVAITGLLTALLRGSLPTAPIILARADTPGTGKSYLVDVIAMVATGRLCPVITASKSPEETEKRIGAVLLSGSAIVSLDNVTYDLGGELLCQITERPVVRIRVLGRSEMPDCECHTAVFATGNNIGFAGDMVRRGLMCDLEALEERPELRAFQCDAIERANADRAEYVAAALTIVRAYLAAGAPSVCGPFGSYSAWSTMVRSPLVWLGEPDPIESMEEIRAEDPELTNIREFFSLWPDYMLLDAPYTTARIIEIANEQAPTNFNTPWLKSFLLKVAAAKGKGSEVSPERLGWWLRRISGRVVNKHRLVREQGAHNVAAFRLTRMS